MRMRVIGEALLSLAGCGRGWGPVLVVGSTPGTIILRGGGWQTVQTFLSTAQAQCTAYGYRQAVRTDAFPYEENFFIQVQMTFECRERL